MMSATVTPSNTVALKAAIVAAFIAQLVPGGALAGVKRVGSEWLNEAKIYPFVHISHSGFTQSPYTSHKLKRLDNFVIGVAYRSTLSLDDAAAGLEMLLDDGNGNGVLAILNAKSSWGGLAQYSLVTSQQYYDNLGSTKTAATSEFISYAVVKLAVTSFITAQGVIS